MPILMKKPAYFALIALLMAVLACVSTGPVVDNVEPTGEFATATPGGRISISLLTPTQTFAPSAQDSQPIGPVATQTAIAEQQTALTATAALPTPTVPGVFTDPALCPQPGSPTLPAEPPAFTDYAEVLGAYLSDGGPPTVLEATLRQWEAITRVGGLVVSDRDMTGDSVPEVIVVAFDPAQADRFPQPGDLFIYGCEAARYRLLYRAGYSLERGTPQILSADDINGNLINDLVYALQTCEGATCFQNVSIVEWQLGVESFESLTTEQITEPFAGVEVIDTDGDGLREVVVRSGTIASEEAGPQRTFTTIWAWDGALYTVRDRQAAATEYRIHILHDADDAALRGEFERARDLYRQAIDSEGLQAWQYPDEAEHLRAYARYRLMLTYAVQGLFDNAQAVYDQLLTQYAEGDPPTFNAEPGSEFARMADLWQENFQESREAGPACEVVIGYIRSNPTAIEVLNTFGFANREYTAVDVCPFGIVP